MQPLRCLFVQLSDQLMIDRDFLKNLEPSPADFCRGLCVCFGTHFQCFSRLFITLHCFDFTFCLCKFSGLARSKRLEHSLVFTGNTHNLVHEHSSLDFQECVEAFQSILQTCHFPVFPFNFLVSPLFVLICVTA